jgi:hypothetical protein
VSARRESERERGREKDACMRGAALWGTDPRRRSAKLPGQREVEAAISTIAAAVADLEQDLPTGGIRRGPPTLHTHAHHEAPRLRRPRPQFWLTGPACLPGGGGGGGSAMASLAPQRRRGCCCRSRLLTPRPSSFLRRFSVWALLPRAPPTWSVPHPPTQEKKRTSRPTHIDVCTHMHSVSRAHPQTHGLGVWAC